MVIARGCVENSEYPTLCKTRKLSIDEGEVVVPYTPLCVDIAEEEQPDIQVDVTNVFHMTCFPANSFDDIFMERIYPACIQLDVRTYYNIAHVLKVGGTFIMDVSSLCERDQIQSVKDKFLDFFKKHDIPFTSYALDSRRNALHDKNNVTFAFYKHKNFTLKWLEHKKKIKTACNEIKEIGEFIKKTKMK